MDIIINGTPKEIADLAMELQNRLKSDNVKLILQREGSSICKVLEEQSNTSQDTLRHS